MCGFSLNSLQLIAIQILILINRLLFNIFASESILLFQVVENAEGTTDCVIIITASSYVAFQVEWAHREAWGSTHMYKVCDVQKQLKGNKEAILYCSCVQGGKQLCSGF